MDQGVEIGVGSTAPGGPADIRVGDRVHENERLGYVLADCAQLGGGATVTPGSLVGPGVDIAAGVTLYRNVDEHTGVQG